MERGGSTSALEPAQELAGELLALDLGGIEGLYLTGSAVRGGLRPDSDLDLLMLTGRSLTAADRRDLIGCLVPRSGRSASPPARPVELVSLVVDDIVPWRYPAVRDFLYGQWLRGSGDSGNVPIREPDPNLPVLLTGPVITPSHSSVRRCARSPNPCGPPTCGAL